MLKSKSLVAGLFLALSGITLLLQSCGGSSPTTPAAPAATPTPVTYYSSAPTTLVSSGINSPIGLAFDSFSGSGNIWLVAESNPGTLYQYNASTGANVSSSYYYTGTSAYYFPNFVTVDPNGYLYVSDYYNNQIEVLTSSGAYVNSITGMTKPFGTAVNSAGTTLYVSEDTSPVTCLTYSIAGAGYPKTYTSTANSFPTASGPYEPFRATALALDPSGNVYASDSIGTKILKYHPDGSSPVTFVPVGLSPYGVACDSSGNIFVNEQTSPAYIQEYTSAGSASVSIGGFPSNTSLTSIALDGSGNLYATDNYHNYIFKINK